jgi:hypothetical protein
MEKYTLPQDHLPGRSCRVCLVLENATEFRLNKLGRQRKAHPPASRLIRVTRAELLQSFVLFAEGALLWRRL